jgi:hypothetical protein
MQAKRTISPSDLLSTPDPDRFPLTAPYAADGTRLRPGAVYIRESERAQGVYSFDTQYERAHDVLLHHGFYVAMVRADSKTGSKISCTPYYTASCTAWLRKRVHGTSRRTEPWHQGEAIRVHEPLQSAVRLPGAKYQVLGC